MSPQHNIPTKGNFREKSRSQNRNPISSTTKNNLGMIQFITKACQLCITPLVYRGLEPHQRHCVVSLSKTHLSLLSIGSTQEDPSRRN